MRSNHCAISGSYTRFYCENLFVFEAMSSLLDQIDGADGELLRLSYGIGEVAERERLRAQSHQAKLARLRSLQLAEAQRGEMQL